MSIVARRTATLVAAAATAASILSAVPPSAQATSTVRGTTGWSVATLGVQHDPENSPASTQLVLVSPTGSQYSLARFGYAQVADVSNDGAHVLLYARDRQGVWHHQVFDVATHRSTVIPGRWADMRFTHPAGAALLARAIDQGTAGTGQVYRLDLSGRVTVRYAGTANAASMTQSPDGRWVVTSGQRPLQVNSNGGALVRRLPNPAGYSQCEMGHWSSATQFTAECLRSARPWRRDTFRYSVAGGTPVALTTRLVQPTSSPDGFVDSWSTTRGQVVAAASTCGDPVLGRVNGSRVTLFGSTEFDRPLALAGTSVWYHRGVGCEGTPGALVRHDLATGRSTVLAGGTRNPGLTVTSVAVIDPTR